jgi:asparagine synthase (glutamine-hydrolysing)
MRIDPEEKQPKTYDGTEKYILRKAFDNLKPLFAGRSAMEAKEQFSDGVGYNWINQLIAYCASQVTDEQLAGAIAISVQFPNH